jgi:2-iminobutanoate/2-iminopropanoate deaminase
MRGPVRGFGSCARRKFDPPGLFGGLYTPYRHVKVVGSMRKVVASSEAPAAVGPYSQAIAVGNTLYCAGQIPLDPISGELVSGGVSEQTERVLENIGGVLRANGMTHGHVVKSTVFMTDLSQFGEMNAVYQRYFQPPFPARSTVQVAALPRGASVEIEVIAVADQTLQTP